jgi:hypothetical protein
MGGIHHAIYVAPEFVEAVPEILRLGTSKSSIGDKREGDSHGGGGVRRRGNSLSGMQGFVGGEE